MSHVHLGHKIPWQDLIETCRVPDPSSISLPIGECARIHVIDTATKLKIEHRNYLKEDDICESTSCKTIGTKIFSKRKVKNIDLYSSIRSDPESIKVRYLYFSKKLVDTVLEFGNTEAAKKDKNPTKLLNKDLEAYADEVFAKLNMDNYFTRDCRNNKIVLALFLECDLINLLKLDKSKEISISKAFGTYYGGQAVGRGYIFLMKHHIIPFYLVSNAIIAANYQNDRSKWGLLNPENHFFKWLFSDCDFLTFIPSLRPYLAEDVFMVDLEKTDFHLKEIFKYIYAYTMLCHKISNDSYDQILEMFQDCITHYFKLYKLREIPD